MSVFMVFSFTSGFVCLGMSVLCRPHTTSSVWLGVAGAFFILLTGLLAARR